MEKRQEESLVWLDWAKELQFIAQAGLTYSKDPFDLERFQRIREISAEIVSRQTGLSFERVTDLFCGETGFQTPKLDTRAAIFQDGKILLVEERDGTWSVLEEAGLEVEAVRLLALQDRNLHNRPPYAYNVCKAFVLCEIKGGSFRPNIETQGSAYFALDELPPLSEDKVTREQIVLCFEAVQTDDWVVPFD